MTFMRRAGRVLGAIGGTAAVVAALAGAAPGFTVPGAPSPVRITFLSHVWTDEDATPTEDAARGIQRLASFSRGRVVQRWFALPPTSLDGPMRDSVYPQAAAAIRNAARSSNIVIAWGDVFTGPVLTLAREYPRVRFGLVSPVDVDRYGLTRVPVNVLQGSFRDEEEAFLAGAAAAMATRTQRIGYIGPHELTPRRVGFEAGAFFANPRVRVIVDNVGYPATLNWSKNRIASWVIDGSFEPSRHEVRKAEEVGLAQYARGVDVIYAHAGGSDAGTYEAAAVDGRWVIGSGDSATDAALPLRWRRRMLAMISEDAERAAANLARRLLQPQPLPRHIVWGLTYPGLPMTMIGYTWTAPQFARIAPFGAAIMREIALRHVKVPYSEPQLAAFKKIFPR